VVARPLAALAQQAGKVYRVGVIFTTTPVLGEGGTRACPTGLQSVRTGFVCPRDVEGQKSHLELLSAEGRFERFGDFVAELVHLKADVIVTSARRRDPSRRLVHAIVKCAVLTAASRRTIHNHMVDFSDVQLDRAFAALADPTRRAILDRLAHNSELAVTQIAGRFDVSLPAVIKHLDVLARAGLIERAKTGRTVQCRLRAEPMETAMQWLARYERFWTERLNALAKFVEEDQCSPSPASLSSAASKPRRLKSSRRGWTPKK